MNKILSRSLLLLLLVMAASAGAQTIERPVLTPGMSWTYSFHDTRFSAPASEFTLVVAKADGRYQIEFQNPTLHEQGNYFLDQDLGTLYKSYVYKMFSFPLFVGKKWHFEFDASNGDKQWHHKVAVEVVGFEKVTVPAGTFDSAKVILTDYYNGSAIGGWNWSGVVTDTWWYAPEVRNYAQRTFVDSGSSSSAPIIRKLVKFGQQ